MRAVKILQFLLFFFALLSLLSLGFPENGIKLTNNITLNFPSFKDIFKNKDIEYANISKLINISIDTSNNEKLLLYPPGIDTNLSAEMRVKLHRLQFPDNDRSVLYSFLESLFRIKHDNNCVKIMHYGDSQIEGDRMTSTIRYNLQSRFGGEGPGLVAIADITQTQSIQRDVSSNWKRYTIFGRKDTSHTGKSFGPMLSFSRFSPILKDSLKNDSIFYTAWIEFAPSKLAYSKTKEFKKVSILLGNNKDKVNIELFKNDGEPVANDTIEANQYFKQLSWNFSETPEKLIFKLKSKDSPNLYGASFDGSTGISVDNIPMRGSSGVDFVRIDLKMLSQYINRMNVKLIILQFGVNVAPNVVDNYKFYEEWLYRNLHALKNLSPDLCIIVIGISDMARKTKNSDTYESLPNIKKIRDAQRNAAFRAKCAFWDIYEAMGGENSMPSWVFANPPLAGKDFTHFNGEGARIISQMFVNALLAEYEDYARNRKIINKPDSNNTKNGKNH